MKRIILIFMLITVNYNCFAVTYGNWQTQTQAHIDSLMSYICDDAKTLIKNSSFHDFSHQKLDTTKLSEQCLKKLSIFYRKTNSLYETEEKISIYKELSFGPDIRHSLYIDELFKLAVYQIITDKKASVLNLNKRVTFFTDYRYSPNRIQDSLSAEDYIEEHYIPVSLDEAIELSLKILDSTDIERIKKYENDEDCFWGEIDLSSKKLINEWFLFFEPRISITLSKQYSLSTNGYHISGFIVLSIRNRLLNNSVVNIEQFNKLKPYITDHDNTTKPIKGVNRELNIDDSDLKPENNE